MDFFDLIIVERKDERGTNTKRYARCPSSTVQAGDMVILFGDRWTYEVAKVYSDYAGDITDAVTENNPVFFVKEYWTHGEKIPMDRYRKDAGVCMA